VAEISFNQHRNYRFLEDLKFGSYWENIVMKQLNLVAPRTQMVRWEDHKQLQRIGIDGFQYIVQIPYELKTRRGHCCEDILFEIMSILEKDKPGWYHTSQAPALIYHWLNREETRSVKAYVLNLKRIREEEIVERYIEENEYLKPLYAHPAGQVWTSINIAVPISTIPKDLIREIPPFVEQYTLDDKFEMAMWKMFM
jgi:hypothetical protein